ncbi:hypothetical protein A3D12_00790 [Candidatus Peribacteria bacterium RIFCSPHIGHO2_02_FULL_55_24]|nr:MAG: hypothetical protein A3D12_00790 [Candidatus Peribacteria bacterium RIFCSPHIGHO2_02_FULL_55_24]
MNAKLLWSIVALVFSAQFVQTCPPKKVVAVPPPFVNIEAFGTLKAGVVAIGGETTGYIIVVQPFKKGAKEQVWELSLPKDMLQKAKELDGQLAYVSGIPELRQYGERGLVPTIVVSELRSSEEYLKPPKSEK